MIEPRRGGGTPAGATASTCGVFGELENAAPF